VAGNVKSSIAILKKAGTMKKVGIKRLPMLVGLIDGES
jgi:hypothetical protein